MEDETDKKIGDLIQPDILDALTRLVLINAGLFKRRRVSQLQTGLMKSIPFHVSPSKSVQAPMITQIQKFRYTEFESFQVLESSHMVNELSMIYCFIVFDHLYKIYS